jgi:cytochrome c peroxidase
MYLKAAVIALFVAFAAGVLLFGSSSPAAGARTLEVNINAPTGVRASNGDYVDKVGLHWDAMRGARLYRVFRSTSSESGSAVEVGTTAANYFFDATQGVSGQPYFYFVRAENGTTLSPLSTPVQGTRAIGELDPTAQFQPLNPPVAPAENDITAAKAYLGKALFWDEQLSSTRTVACGTCHRPAAGGSDPRSGTPASRNAGYDQIFGTADDVFGSPGVPQSLANGSFVFDAAYGFRDQVTGRKSPSYLNAGYNRTGLFWDGRATDVFRDQLTNSIVLPSRGALESQAAGPPTSAAEMAHNGRSWSDIAGRIRFARPLVLASDIPAGLAAWIDGRTYPELFEETFGTADVTPARIAMAIATHERTLFSDRTPFDRSNASIELMTRSEQDGLSVFLGANCNVCHSGPLLTNQQFHNIGVRPPIEDTGRGGVTNRSEDNGRFRTPNLRNVELHAPYMHNGRFATLEEVVEFYNRGGDFTDAPNFDDGIIRPLGLTAQEKADLVAFMKRPLTDERVRDELPPFDRPKLFTESERVPVVTGAGRAGAGGIVPEIAAVSPPIVGNPGFAISVGRSLGNSQATLVVSETDPGVGTEIPAQGTLARVVSSTQGTGAGNGWASATVQIPNSPIVVGRTYFARWYVQDPAAANGFAVSRAVRFTVFGEAFAVPTASITGRVTTPSGQGLRNAVVTLTDSAGVRRTATTSSFGIYQFADVSAGPGFTMGVASKRYRFAPRTFDLSANLTGMDFAGLE